MNRTPRAPRVTFWQHEEPHASETMHAHGVRLHVTVETCMRMHVTPFLHSAISVSVADQATALRPYMLCKATHSIKPMYEKNCLTYGFLSTFTRDTYAILCQWHPSSVQERHMLHASIHAIDAHASVHTLQAHTLRHAEHDWIEAMVQTTKGPSCVIVCSSSDTFHRLLRTLMHRAHTTCVSVVGAKYGSHMLSPASLHVMATHTLDWTPVFETVHASSVFVGHMDMCDSDHCTCEPHDHMSGKDTLSAQSMHA